jgi:hypothetical protein
LEVFAPVVVRLLHQLPLAPILYSTCSNQGARQLLGRDRRPADAGVEPREARREFAQDGVDQPPHRAQRMVGRDAPLHGNVAPHRALIFLTVTPYAHLCLSRPAHRSRISYDGPMIS